MIPDWLSLIDVAFVLVLLLFAWDGYQKGFAAQVAYILAFLFLAGGLFFAYPGIYRFLSRVFERMDEAVMMWLLLAGLILLTYLVFTLLSKMLAHLLKMRISERADRINGLLLGAIRGGLTALLVLIVLGMVGPQKLGANFGNKSYIGTFVVQKLVPRIRPHINHSVVEETARELKYRLENKNEAGSEVFD